MSELVGTNESSTDPRRRNYRLRGWTNSKFERRFKGASLPSHPANVADPKWLWSSIATVCLKESFDHQETSRKENQIGLVLVLHFRLALLPPFLRVSALFYTLCQVAGLVKTWNLISLSTKSQSFPPFHSFPDPSIRCVDRQIRAKAERAMNKGRKVKVWARIWTAPVLDRIACLRPPHIRNLFELGSFF